MSLVLLIALAICAIYDCWSYELPQSVYKLKFENKLFAFSGPKKSSPSKRKAAQQQNKSSKIASPSSIDDEYSKDREAKVLTTKTILGQSVITGREFKLETKKEFKFLGSFTSLKDIPIYPLPEIAFLGRSNVGKSSLLNCISGANKNLAVESKTPGRTQCINLFKCSDNEGDICIFTDLPGYGYANISKEQQEKISRFVNDYLKNRDALKLATVIVDSRREEQALDRSLMQFLAENGIPYGVVATKIDKLSKAEQEKSLKNLQDVYQLPTGFPIRFSSETGEGKKFVWKMIRDGILERNVFSEEERLIEEDKLPQPERINGKIILAKSEEYAKSLFYDGEDFL